MVGITTWRAREIVWILEEWRTGRNIDALVEKFQVEFPDVKRNSLHKSITYVWQKYSKDPSYNHKFSTDEIAVIMEQHFIHKVDLERLVEKFQEFFPEHDWNRHVDRRTAINCVVGKYGLDHAIRCALFGNDEKSFILRNRLKLKSWDRLLEEVQAWTKRRDVTMDSLLYLCLISKFYHLETKEGLENHYQASLDSFDVENFTQSEVFYDISDWKRAYHDTTKSSLIEEISSSKRKREVDIDGIEIKSKRIRHISPQLGCNKGSEELDIGAHSMKPSTNLFASNDALSSVVATKPCGSLARSRVKPYSQLSRARTQNTESIESVISGHNQYAPNSNSTSSTIQSHSLEESMRIGELGIEHSLSDQESTSSSRQAPITQNFVAELPARAIVTQTNAKTHYDQDGHKSAYTEANASLGWQEYQEYQLEYTSERLGEPTGRDKNRYDTVMEYSTFQNQFIPLEYLYSTIGVGGETMSAWTNSDLQHISADLIPSGNLNASLPRIPIEFPTICHMGIASPCLPDINSFNSRVNFNETVPWQTMKPMQAPSFRNLRNVSTDHIIRNDTVVFPGTHVQLARDPFLQQKQLLDPALFNEPNSIPFQQKVEGNCFQQVYSTSAQATNLKSESLLQQSSDGNIKSLPVENMEVPLRTDYELASIDFRKVNIRRQDELQLSRADAFQVTLDCTASDDAKEGELSVMANRSVPRAFNSCEANQHDNNKNSEHQGFTGFETTHGITSALDPFIGIEQQLYSYLGQNGSSYEAPIIIMEEEYEDSVPAMQEWDIYSVTPLHTLFPSDEGEPPVFEPDLTVSSEKDYKIGEHNTSDILQEVAALGEMVLSQNMLCPSVIGDNH